MFRSVNWVWLLLLQLAVAIVEKENLEMEALWWMKTNFGQRDERGR